MLPALGSHSVPPAARTAAATVSLKSLDRNTASCGKSMRAMAPRLRQSTHTRATSCSTAIDARMRSDARWRAPSNGTTAMSPCGRT